MRITNHGIPGLALLFLLFAPFTASPAHAERPTVIVSVAPLHSLVAGIMAGVGTPHVLIRGGRSPHDMALRPSDIRRLNGATLVVWIGPGLESYLVKPLGRLNRASVLTLYDAPGVGALPRRAGGAWEDDRDHAGHESGGRNASHGLSPFYADPHIWLSPENARAIVRAVARRLRDRDPTNAAAYTANEARTLGRIDSLDREIGATLAPVTRLPYIVFHDAYRYFERHYGLNAMGAISASPERAPGARRLLEIRQRIRERHAACVFREPQFPPRVIATIVDGTDARVGVLDPLGAGIPPGPDHWFTLMRNLAAALVKCLKPAG